MRAEKEADLVRRVAAEALDVAGGGRVDRQHGMFGTARLQKDRPAVAEF